MADYRIFETVRFAKDLKQIAAGPHPNIAGKLGQYVYPQLHTEPHFGSNIKRLKGWDPPTWRYRIGDWRFFYEVDEGKKIIFMTAAAHRSRAY